MDVTVKTSTTPSIYIGDTQNRHQTQQLQHHQHQMAKYRKESIAYSQSIGGVSWGSLTVGSWLKEEVMIHANMKDSFNNSSIAPTNIVPFSSPPSSSGSYLPNLEKQYCRDYNCCGQLLPGLHDLLRHYEEAHIATSPSHPSMTGGSGNSVCGTVGISVLQNGNVPNRKKINHVQQHGQQHFQTAMSQHQAAAVNLSDNIQHLQIHHPYGNANVRHLQLQNQVQIPNHSALSGTVAQTQPQSALQSEKHLHMSNNLVDAVSTNEVFLQTNDMGSGVENVDSDGLIGNSESKPEMNFAGNKGASLPQKLKSARKQRQQSQHVNFNNYSLQMNLSCDPTTSGQHTSQSRLVKKNSASPPSGIELDFMDQDFIDEFNQANTPFLGIHHFSPTMARSSIVENGNINSQTSANMATMVKKNNNFLMNNSPRDGSLLTVKRSNNSVSRAHHSLSADDDDDDDLHQDDDIDDEEPSVKSRKKQGYIDDPARRLYVMDHEEHKPFKCPVIGCDKTYKNQNGLKYHKTHGHQNQKLYENSDGTFSIINPESNEPYPEGMGFEKDKPYRCEVCGKRYKNLNGLKYHRGHSSH